MRESKMPKGKCDCRAFKMVEGRLVCESCGEPSRSEKWPSNIYGFETQEAAEAAQAMAVGGAEE